MQTNINIIFGPRIHKDECFLLPTICLDFPKPEGTVLWVSWLWYGLYFGMVDDETLSRFGD